VFWSAKISSGGVASACSGCFEGSEPLLSRSIMASTRASSACSSGLFSESIGIVDFLLITLILIYRIAKIGLHITPPQAAGPANGYSKPVRLGTIYPAAPYAKTARYPFGGSILPAAMSQHLL